MQYRRDYAGRGGWTAHTSNARTLKEFTTPMGHRVVFQTWHERVVSDWWVTNEHEVALLWVPELGDPFTSFDGEIGKLFVRAGLAGDRPQGCISEIDCDSNARGYINWNGYLLDSPRSQPKILAAVTRVANNLEALDKAIEAALDATVRKRSAFDMALATL